METPPPSKIGHDEDIISALPDDLLLGILECLDLPQAVRAGALSRRWRHLPHQLSCLDLDVKDFQGTTMLETMDVFTGAVCTLLSACPTPAECKCDCGSRRPVKILRLCFYTSATHLGSIGRADEDTVSRGETDRFELEVIPHSSDDLNAELDAPEQDDDLNAELDAPKQDDDLNAELDAPEQDDYLNAELDAPEQDDDLNAELDTLEQDDAELGQQFMSFSRTFPIAFRCLTDLSLTCLDFGDSDLTSLLGSCDKLKHLSLTSCDFVGQSVLMIDVPSSIITKLDLIDVGCTIELVSVPKLTQLSCYSWRSENPPLRFGYVPELQILNLSSHAKAWQPPFALSECLSKSARNLSKLYFNFESQMIWIQPEHPKQLTAIFRKLTCVILSRIFPDCDLNWTLFFLEVAPALKIFFLTRARHSCDQTSEDSAEKTNVVWEPSKDLKHLNLATLVMVGFEEEDKVANYLRLVMERATRLKRIKLRSRTCDKCNAIDPESPKRSQSDEASKRRIKELLTSGGASSSVKIILG